MSLLGTWTKHDFEDTSVPNDTLTNIASLDVSAGTYLIIFVVAWQKNATGYRQIGVAENAPLPSGKESIHDCTSS